MIIFIQNIPEHTTKENIRKFVTPALKRLGLIRLGDIKKIDLLSIVNKHSGSIRYASIVRIDTEIATQIVVDKLNGKQLKGRIVTVREYKIRTAHNDPRIRYPRNEINNKRVADRRVVSDFEMCEISELPKLLRDLNLKNARTEEEYFQILSFKGDRSQYTTKYSDD